MTADTAVAAPPALSRAQTNIVFATVALGMLMAALDQTIVSTALPTIVADLGGATHMSWVVTAYMLAETVSTALAGKFGDLFGRKRVFQLGAIVFILGSMLSGVANSMGVLIVGRAVQGLGAGALMVTAMALIADVIPLRDRGKYQGAMGAVFGVTTVLGPTLGGVFTDHATWRWCFYVNVPIAVLVVAVAARTIPQVRGATRPVIDYLGIALVSLGSVALVLALSWGGNEYPWGSGVIVGLFLAAAALYAAFVFAERRAAEPMLPMSLFRMPVFAVCSVLSFIVGFAMLGAMTFLPTFLQYVDGASATVSGLRTLPMVAGMLITSIASGQAVSRTGRYKLFPIAGCAVIAAGLFLMSTMRRGTSVWESSLYMFVLGLGLGLAMQVLTIAVQNTVPYAQLGTATSGVTFFRTLGSAFGTAVFGTLYNNHLTPALRVALAKTPGLPAAAAKSPQALRQLPAAAAHPIIDAYADSIDFVFRCVAPVAVVGFVVAWFLKEVPLRDSARADAADLGEGFAVPDSPDRLVQLERAVATVMRSAADSGDYPLTAILAAAGSALSPGTAWVLHQIQWRTKHQGQATVAAVARAHHLPADVLRPAFDAAARAGLIRRDGDAVRLTTTGLAEYDRLAAAWRRWLDERICGWTIYDPEDRALLDHALANIANKLLDDERTHFERAAV